MGTVKTALGHTTRVLTNTADVLDFVNSLEPIDDQQDGAHDVPRENGSESNRLNCDRSCSSENKDSNCAKIREVSNSVIINGEDSQSPVGSCNDEGIRPKPKKYSNHFDRKPTDTVKDLFESY